MGQGNKPFNMPQSSPNLTFLQLLLHHDPGLAAEAKAEREFAT